jgi:hypothetical protein
MYSSDELVLLLKDKLESLNEIPNSNATNIETAVQNIKDREIVVDAFNDKAEIVATIYPKGKWKEMKEMPKINYPIVINAECPPTKQEFADSILNFLQALVRGLPDNTWRNRTKRFFTRAAKVSMKELQESIKEKTNLEELLQELIDGKESSGILSDITDRQYENHYFVYCICYKIVKYFVENQRYLSIDSRITIAKQVYFFLSNVLSSGGFLQALRALFNSSFKRYTDLPREEHSTTYRDILRLYQFKNKKKIKTTTGGINSRITPRRRHKTKRTTSNRVTRKTARRN